MPGILTSRTGEYITPRSYSELGDMAHHDGTSSGRSAVAPRFEPHSLVKYDYNDEKYDQLERKMAMLQQQIANNDSLHISHSMQACRAAKATQESLEETKSATRSDMTILMEEINEIKRRFKSQSLTEQTHMDKVVAAIDQTSHQIKSSHALPLPHPDEPIPSIEDPAVNKVQHSPTKSSEPPTSNHQNGSADEDTDDLWQSLVVREMPPLSGLATISCTETFTYSFLSSLFGGTEWSPGFYWVPSNQPRRLIQSYYILESTHEPYLPSTPGAHGAKLTAFFNNTPTDEDDPASPTESAYRTPSPVFIATDKPDTYVYYGMYTQPRFSDRLDHDTMSTRIPQSVKIHWATTLSSPGRAEWVTEALMHHFWPQPAYSGPITRSNNGGTTVDTKTERKKEKKVAKALKVYMAELEEWERDARLKVGLVKCSDIETAFAKSDASEEPGLRLWWEYLQCVGWDKGFYDMLVGFKDKERK